VAVTVLVAASLCVGLYRVGDTGPLWPDSPRYANAAAMMHDWLLSGEFLHPYAFAQRNYSQYPAFNVPFHPPAYPGLLGLAFVATGVSYETARAFVAVCLAACACICFAVQRGLGLRPAAAFASALLLVTTPEIARWSRDTMSEIPSLAFLFAASWAYLAWLRSDRGGYAWLAFVLAEAAFLSRVTTAGVLPAWFLYPVLVGQARRLWSPNVVLPALLYLAANAAWVAFVAQFSRYEVAADGKAHILVGLDVSYFTACVPAMALWGTSVAGLVGAGLAAWLRRCSPIGLFWLCWLLSYTSFKLVVPSTDEVRHFLTALPALAGLAGCLFADGVPDLLRRRLGPALIGLALAVNVVELAQLPRGVVGYAAVGQCLASLERPGNVLLCCWEDQELIFRYRASAPALPRRMVRGDRCLAIRLADYAGVDARQLVHTPEEFLEVIRRGRVRYVVTCAPDDLRGDERPEEMVLAHQVAGAHSDQFRPIGTFPLVKQYNGRGLHGQVFLWEFVGDLPEGPDELPVVIPTAGLQLPGGV
jgi:4-amino-4-deoxy-L-arabinose transferase-like glycosyltransferase